MQEQEEGGPSSPRLKARTSGPKNSVICQARRGRCSSQFFLLVSLCYTTLQQEGHNQSPPTR
jgi:hypothetical protein